MEPTLPLSLTYSKLKASDSPPPPPTLLLSLWFSVKQRQLQCVGLKGPFAKLKPDSSCLSADQCFLIQPSPQTSQLQIQINTLQLNPPPPAPLTTFYWCGFSHFLCASGHFFFYVTLTYGGRCLVGCSIKSKTFF